MGYDVRFGVDLFVHFCLPSRPAIHPNLSFALFTELAIGSKVLPWVILKTLQVRTIRLYVSTSLAVYTDLHVCTHIHLVQKAFCL